MATYESLKEYLGIMDESVHIEQYKGYTIKIEYDLNAMNPRKEFDNMGTMVTWKRGYTLGDKQPRMDKYDYFAEVIRGSTAGNGRMYNSYWYPLYECSSGSDVRLRVGEWMEPYDDSQIGWIYVSKADVRKEYGIKHVKENHKLLVQRVLKGEVEEYNAYLSGEVYGWTVVGWSGEDPNYMFDSVWGYYDYDYCLSDAKICVDYLVRKNGEAEVPNEA